MGKGLNQGAHNITIETIVHRAVASCDTFDMSINTATVPTTSTSIASVVTLLRRCDCSDCSDCLL